MSKIPRTVIRKTFLMFLGGLAFAFVGAAIAYGVWVLVYRPKPSPAPQTGVITVPTTTETMYQPEIPINEYWDYAVLNGLHIYVNNTDRNVIYALDEHGKIAWTFWAKDYGLNGYEIRHTDRYIFLTGSTGNWSAQLVVLGVDGKFRWIHSFEGYLDMPKMLITSSNMLVLDENNSGPCDVGCGILCGNKPSSDDYCESGALWAFDLDTGRVVWKNTTRDFYFYIQSELPDGRVQSTSAGVGPGRWSHTYVVSSTTGIIEEHSAIVNDVQFGQDNKQLVLDENRQTISLTDYYSTTTHWTVHAPNPLYDLIQDKGQKTGLKIYVLKDIILADLGGPGNLTWMTYGIDKQNGKILWSKDFDSVNGISSSWKTIDGVLLFIQEHLSACEEICRTCPKNAWVCADVPPSAECDACQKKEQDAPGYWQGRVWGVDALTGKTLWTFASKSWASADVPTAGPVTDELLPVINVTTYENSTTTVRVLDVHTGLEQK